MECSEFLRVLSEADEADLPGTQADDLGRHAESCESCRSEVDAASSELRELLGSDPPPRVTSQAWAGVFDGVMAGLERQEGEPEQGEPLAPCAERDQLLRLSVAAALRAAPKGAATLRHPGSGLLDGPKGEDISERGAELLERHVGECETCRSALETAARDLRSLAMAGAPAAPSPGEWDRVFEGVLDGLKGADADDTPAPIPMPVALPLAGASSARGARSAMGMGLLAVAAAVAVMAILQRPVGQDWQAGCEHCDLASADLSDDESVRLEYLEGADDVNVISILPDNDDEVLVIFMETVEDIEGESG